MLKYVLAVIVTIVALLVTLAVQPFVAPSVTPPFILAVAVAAVYGGRGPGAVAAALSVAALSYWFFPPFHADTPSDLARQLMFLVVAMAVTWIGGAAHDQRRRALEQAAENLRLRQEAEDAALEAEMTAQQLVEANRQAEDEMAKARDAALEAELAAQEAAEALARQQEAEAAERKAQEAVARLAAIVTSSSDAIVGKTLEGVVTSWNTAAERIFGYSASEMVGESVFKLIPEEHHDQERGVLDRLRRGELMEVSEAERVRKDGRRIWISLSVSPVRDVTGAVTGAASIKRDISDRKMLEERLRDTQRLQAVGQLAGGIAHEANNQMSVVLVGTHFLLGRADLPAAVRSDVEHIRQAAERTAAITQQLLAFSRRQRLEIRDVDLNAVLQSILPVLRRSLTESHELVVRPGRLGGVIRADPRQLEQVLLNLTLNARDAMPAGGQLALETREVELTEAQADQDGVAAGTYASLVVRDTGQGMSRVVLDRAFEPFFTTKDVGQGTGLGLSVVHGIVSQLGGHIRVESAVNQGTTFTLYFPTASRTSAAEPAPDEPHIADRGAVALVVEDDSLVRGMVSRALAEAGYNVLEAENGRAALNLVRAHRGRLDLVVTDVGMPVMNGYELARCLQQERPGLPLVFMTGYGDDAPHGPTALMTAAPLIQKPFAPDVLVRVVGDLLHGKRDV